MQSGNLKHVDQHLTGTGNADINALILNVVEEKRVVNSQSQFSYDLCTDPTTASCNPQELARVFSNLINNSLEAMDKPTEQISIKTSVNNGFVEITIQDNGKGVPAKILPKLGTEGFTFEKEKGSGLGLFHAKNTIESWGGSFELSSVDLIGTRVKI